MIDMWKIKGIQDEVFAELIEATSKHGSFRSAHEGYAIIKEEVDELWDEVKHKVRSEEAMYKEAIQIAAMAVRFLYDLRDIQRRAVTESESARWADLTPPASQRTSQSEDRQSLAAVPLREWPADALQTVEPDPSDPARVIVRRKLDHGDEGPLVQNAGRPLHWSPSGHRAIPGLHYAEPAGSLLPLGEEGQNKARPAWRSVDPLESMAKVNSSSE